MVKLILIMGCCFFMLPPLQAGQLMFDLPSDQVEMGKSLTFKMIYTGTESVGEVLLDQWQEDFFIDRGNLNVENLLNGDIQTTQKIKLFPRHTGEITLAPIALGGSFIKSKKIKVKPSIRHGIDGTPYWSDLPKKMWQGQTIDACIKMNLFESENHYKIDEPLLVGFTQLSLPVQKKMMDGHQMIQQCWRLTADQVGRQKLSLSVIEQRGRGRWQYFIEQPVIDILPLPSYIPVSIPVGKIHINSKVVNEKQQKYWAVSIDNSGILETEVYGLRTQLAQLSDGDVDRVMIKQGKFLVPLPMFSLGMGRGPEISVQYFDVESGRLQRIHHNLPAVWQLPVVLKIVLFFMIGVVSLYSLLFLFQRIKKHRLKRIFTVSLNQIKDKHELRRFLLEKTMRRQSKTNSLEAWAYRVQQDKAYFIARQLNRLCFSLKKSVPLSELKKEILQIGSVLWWPNDQR